KPVFKQPLNLHISKNQKIAIDGDSGSGKSTFLKIISGQIKNYQGSVKINNQDEKTLSYDAIREVLIYVDQIPYLFNGTIRYNLELGEHFSDQEIFDALRKADLLDYVKELRSEERRVGKECGSGFARDQFTDIKSDNASVVG